MGISAARRASIKRGRLTKDEDRAIEEMSARGVRTGVIALRLCRHPGTINFAMVRLGLKAPTPRTFEYSRNGSAVRSFAPDEDALIEALRVQGCTYKRIAEVAGQRFGHTRTAATIGVRLKMLANTEEACGP